MTTTIATDATTVIATLEGTYELRSFEVRLQDGTTIHPLGPDAVGRLSYDAAGRMAVHVMRADRPAFASGDMLDATSEELRDAWDGYIGYAGGFSVDVDAGTVEHHIEISSFPNWVGNGQVRFFELDGDTLELTTAPLAYGGSVTVAALVWQRV